MAKLSVMSLSKADTLQIEFYRKRTGEERLMIAARLRSLSLKLMEAGIRDAHPDWTEERVHFGVISRLLPPVLFKKAYPNAHC